jgi:hypothetical protein
MTRLTIVACLAALALAPDAARAEMIDFSYSWSMGPSSVYAAGTGSVAFSLKDGGTTGYQAGPNPTRLEGATISTTSSAGGAVAADSYSTDFALTLHLTDTASGQSGDVTFGATLGGTLTFDSSALSVAFDKPPVRQLRLGGRLYSVTIDPALVHVPAPGSSDPGSIDALVRVAPRASASNGPPPALTPQEAPEPASLLTGAVGAGLGALAWLRRRRRALSGPSAA